MASGKGDKRRPAQVSDEELRVRWARALGGCPWCGAPRSSLVELRYNGLAMSVRCRSCRVSSNRIAEEV